MKRFFQNFPTLYYPYGDNYKLATDILRRVDFTSSTKAKNSGLVDYRLRDGDTPDNVAARFYGSPHLHWIILIINEITNPYYGWPLKSQDFDAYVTRKYGAGFENNPHHVEILNTGIQVDAWDPLYLETGELLLIEGGMYDGQALLMFDAPEYPNEQLTMISNYQYEFAVNEQKRNIKLLRPEFVNQAAAQLEINLKK